MKTPVLRPSALKYCQIWVDNVISARKSAERDYAKNVQMLADKYRVSLSDFSTTSSACWHIGVGRHRCWFRLRQYLLKYKKNEALVNELEALAAIFDEASVRVPYGIIFKPTKKKSKS